jgi:hypothetical protein
MSDYSQAICVPGATARPFRAEERSITFTLSVLLPSFGTVVFAVALFQVLFLAQGTRSLFRDSDSGWHIRNGEAIIDNLAVPHADRFSYTRNGQSWFAWEWLSDASFGVAYRLGGLAAVSLFAALIIALTVWLAARFSLSFGGNLFMTAPAMVFLLGTTSIHWLARPHIFSWLLSLVVLWIAERERNSPAVGSGRLLYAVPLIACLWANVHGSFLLAPGILFIYAIGAWLGKQESVRFLAASLAALAATFVNPYGWRLHDHVFAYLNNDYLMDHIAEFRSYSFHMEGSFYVEMFLFIAVLGTLALLKQRAFAPALLALGLLHISLYSARHLPTAAVLLLPLCVASLSKEAREWPRLRGFFAYSERLQSIDAKVWGVVPAVFVLALTLAGVDGLARAGRVGFDPAMFPVRAADFLEKQSTAGRIFTKDQWGGYLIYRFNGRTKVFLDGRSDFYGRDLLETYEQVVEVKPGWDSILKQYNVRTVLIPPDHALASALRLSGAWKQVYGDSAASVFERTGA